MSINTFMKVAIYGDSFGYEDLLFNEYHPNVEKIGKSWVSYLKDYYRVDNFCKPASDLYYSYKQFLNNYKKYDKNIFLITSPGRLSFKFNTDFIHSHNLISAMGKLKIEKNSDNQKALQAAIDYFNFIQDIERDKCIDNLLIKEIIQLDSNALVINCFGDNGLYNITKLEDSTWNIKLTYSALDSLLDIRYSHMTKENNLVLFDIVKDCIDNNKKFVFNLSNFNSPAMKQKDLYLVQKK